jgi:hypothetical protein
MRVFSTLLAAAISLASGSAVAGTYYSGSYEITATYKQLTTTYPGASTFADTTTLAGYLGGVTTAVATITGGVLDPSGSTNPDTGIDNSITNYLAALPGSSIKIEFDSFESYFGMLWGSVDADNTVSLYDGTYLLGSFTGATLSSSSAGLQGYPAAGSFVDFVAYSPTFDFDTVVLSGTASPFEVDNLATIASAAVPEPSSWSLLILGSALLGGSRRGRARRLAGA